MIFKSYLKFYPLIFVDCSLFLFYKRFSILLTLSQWSKKKKKTNPQVIQDREGEMALKQEECLKCEQKGSATQTFKTIQNFKEVIVVDFKCKQCGFSNSYLDFVEKKNDFGIEILYKLQHAQDSERTVVHSQNAFVKIQELDFAILCKGKPQSTTIRGLIQKVIQQLKSKNQKIQSTESSPKQDNQNLQILQKAQKALSGKLLPLTIRIRDPSGNSNVKNLNYPLPDKKIQNCYFQRSVQQLMELGFSKQEAEEDVKMTEQRKKGIKLNFNMPFEEKDFMNKQPVIFEVPCHTCMMPGQMKLCETSVPYFTDLVIMSFTCQYCGAHSVQTKNGGQVSEQAIEITLKVDSDVDLKRDLFKSQTCKVCIPQAQLQLDYGTLGGQYTTVEGLLEKIHENLSGRNQFVDLDNEFSVRMKQFLGDILKMKDGQKPFTLKLVDPLSRSFLQNPFHPLEDKKAKRVSRARNQEEEDFLGFAGMNTENYL